MAETTRGNPSSSGTVAPGGSTTAPPPVPSAPTADASKAQNAEQAPDGATAGTTVRKAVFDSKGGVEERVLTAKDFEDNAILDHGMEGDNKGDLRWSRENNFVVDVSHLSEEALDLLSKDPQIKVKSKTVEA
jgi:hypothetical protein